jgi:hypothetical protein
VFASAVATQRDGITETPLTCRDCGSAWPAACVTDWQAPARTTRRARQLGTPGGLPPKGRDESCRTAYGELPGSDPGRLRRATLAAHPFRPRRTRFSRFTSRADRPGAPKGAPLK